MAICDTADREFVVIGGGPAGLTAAYELARLGCSPTVVEKAHIVGGLARTERYGDYYFDLGGHRFYTKSQQVQTFWEEILGDDLLQRPRLSRIFYRNVFFDYPLKPRNALSGVGFTEATRVIVSYLRWKAFPYRTERTFEQWVTNRFGKRLFEIFFKSYTEKVWGIPCHELRAEWAAQRIKDLCLATAVLNMFVRPKVKVRTLIDEFHYPRLGPGMLWNRVKDGIEDQGGKVFLDTNVVEIQRSRNRINSLTIQQAGRTAKIEGTDFISSMPVTQLIKRLDPPPPERVLRAADRLRYRDFLTVCLIVDRSDLFPDNWIYIHEPNVRVARIQNFKNWSIDMVPDPRKTSLGLEYFCQQGDDLWNRSDTELIRLAADELQHIGLVKAKEVEDGCVFRVPQSYPVYDSNYREFLLTVQDFLSDFENLQTIGRNGLHRYNNQDHAMLTGMYAVRNALLDEQTDLWSVCADNEFLEEIREDEKGNDVSLRERIESE